MVQMLQQRELELSVDEKNFILESFKKNKKELRYSLTIHVDENI